MRNIWKARLAVGALLLVASMGCNPILLTAYLFNNEDPKTKAEFPLKPRPKHEKDEVRVVVLTSCAPGYSAELMGIDRLLASEIIPLLEKRCVENKEKVTVLKSQPIEEYKKKNPDWRSEKPTVIGKELKADYLIDIEVLEISIYEPRTNQQFLKGRAKISMLAYDLSNPLDEAAFKPSEYVFDFPRTHLVPVQDTPPSKFRQEFIKRIAQDLVMPFVSHTTNQRMVD